ncbi:MAG: NADH-quinone oxidoreductase subunit C [Candidatus Thorarchaeota archaeon]|nr:MAG: NADH-quinone oxidoreductase subunit C [Candidatus Thorarchaeota archaeon]
MSEHMKSSGSASTLGRDIVNKFPEVQANPLEGNRIELVMPADKIRAIVALLDESVSDFLPESMFAVDLENDQYELIYIFWSHSNKLLCQLRVPIEGEAPEVESVSDIYPGFEWHERETHEMFGIGFSGHPDLRLLLLPEELEGKYPLRKSFQTDRSRLEESGLPQPKPKPPAAERPARPTPSTTPKEGGESPE